MADLVILIATMGLNLAILPTLRAESKPPLGTSIGFACCVLAIGGALLSLGLWMGGGANILAGGLWAVLVVQTLAKSSSPG